MVPEKETRFASPSTQAAFRRSLASIEPLSSWLMDFAKLHGLDGSVTFELDLALEEIFTNMVKYNPDGEESVQFRITKTPPEIVITIVDGGVPFDMTKAKQIDVGAPLSERNAGGLGIHLVRKMIDRIVYRYVDGRNEVTLFKTMEK